MGKKKKMSIIIILITLICIIAGGTLAMWQWTSSNTNVGFTVSGLDAYIIYNKGTDVLTGTLNTVENYTDTDVSTEITLYKNTDKTIYGHIYLDIEEIGPIISKSPAVKWVITSNGKVLNQGNFVASSVDDSIPLSLNIPLSKTEQKFQIYIWFDKNVKRDKNIKGESLSTIVRAEASEVEYDSEPNKPDLVNGLVPITYSNNKWVKADRYNKNNNWYDYNNKQWANAVLVNEYASNYSTTIYDMSGNNKNGTISGATYTDEGLSFDGVDDYILLPSSLGATLPATYSITFKTNSTGNQILFGDYSTSATVGLYSNNTKLIVSLHSSNATYTFATGGISVGTYYTIDIVYNSLSSISVYLNGSKLTQNSDTNYWTWPDTNSYIGKRASGTNFNGTIKNFIVYDDVLTANEIKYNLDANKKAVCDDGIVCDNLKLYYNFEGTTRDNYLGAGAGMEIKEDDILAYYVWIPRYKYKVWNINKVIGTDSYSANTIGVDIKFESGTSTTGTIKCTSYSFAAPSSSAGSPNETCSGANGDYYTHPAFTFGSDELSGIWVGKYEVSTPSTSTCYTTSNATNCRNITLTPRIKPNANPWRFNYVTNFSYVFQNMTKINNEYGLNKDADSHLIKNMEWGSVAYLTYSNYGKCGNGSCTEVGLNSYYVSDAAGYKTGCGPQSSTSTSTGTTCNAYNTTLGQLASTTGNVYGIYDMRGGAWDWIMANMSSAAGSYTYYPLSGGSNFTYSEDTAKYIDTYAYYASSTNQQSYNRSRLGDAIGEVGRSTGKGWFSDSTGFITDGYPWLVRGSLHNSGVGAGLFSAANTSGSNTSSTGRATLVVPNY